MASLEKSYNKTRKWEGGYCDIAGDKGGETIFGIARNFHVKLIIWETIDNYKKLLEPFNKSKYKALENKCLENKDFMKIVHDFYRDNFWDKIKGDSIEIQENADILFDYAVNSGVGIAVKKAQGILGLKADGILGNITLAKINEKGIDFCNELCKAREEFFITISKKGENAKFLKGWLNRVNDFYVR